VPNSAIGVTVQLKMIYANEGNGYCLVVAGRTRQRGMRYAPASNHPTVPYILPKSAAAGVAVL